MLKIRLQGTTNELKWFRKILEKNSNFEILSISSTTNLEWKHEGDNSTFVKAQVSESSKLRLSVEAKGTI